MLTSKAMTKAQTKTWLLNFNFANVHAILAEAEKLQPDGRAFCDVYGTGVDVRYSGDGRWYVRIQEGTS